MLKSKAIMIIGVFMSLIERFSNKYTVFMVIETLSSHHITSNRIASHMNCSISQNAHTRVYEH